MFHTYSFKAGELLQMRPMDFISSKVFFYFPVNMNAFEILSILMKTLIL